MLSVECWLCLKVSVQYSQSEKQFRLLFGTIGQTPLPNCHTLVSTYLEKDLNSTKSVAHLSKVSLLLANHTHIQMYEY